jgi:hypothetical protein
MLFSAFGIKTDKHRVHAGSKRSRQFLTTTVADIEASFNWNTQPLSRKLVDTGIGLPESH